ncbi:MAG: nuclear transport factor 2 family protein [Vicinamibacteria bacterium]
MNLSEFPKEIVQMLDRQQIEDVLTRYSRAVDRAELGLLKSCYHEGATEDHAGVFKGTAAEYIENLAPILPRAGVMNHMVMNVLVEFNETDPNAAKVEAYILAFSRMKKDGEKFDTLTLARSVDRFEKRDGRWAIAVRRLCFEWNHEMPMLESWGRGLMIADPKVLVRGGKHPNDIVYRD